MTDMTKCNNCGFEWESRLTDCGHDDAIAAGAARTALRDGLVDLADAIMLIGTALGFSAETKCVSCGQENPEGADDSWAEFDRQATAWADKMTTLYPELNTDEQFTAAMERLERMVPQK